VFVDKFRDTIILSRRVLMTGPASFMKGFAVVRYLLFNLAGRYAFIKPDLQQILVIANLVTCPAWLVCLDILSIRVMFGYLRCVESDIINMTILAVPRRLVIRWVSGWFGAITVARPASLVIGIQGGVSILVQILVNNASEVSL